jgi:hypothetical protein
MFSPPQKDERSLKKKLLERRQTLFNLICQNCSAKFITRADSTLIVEKQKRLLLLEPHYPTGTVKYKIILRTLHGASIIQINTVQVVFLCLHDYPLT